MFSTQATTKDVPTSIEEWVQQVRQLHDGNDWETSVLPTLPIQAPAWCIEIEEDRSDYPTIMYCLQGRQWSEENSVNVEQFVIVKVDAAEQADRLRIFPAEISIIVEGNEISAAKAIELATALEGAASELERWAA